MPEILDRIVKELAREGLLLTIEAKEFLKELDENDALKICKELPKRCKETFVTVEQISRLVEEMKKVEAVPSAKPFKPLAKEIKGDIKVLRDPGRKIRFKKAEDITSLLKDRLNKLSRRILEKINLREAESIREVNKARKVNNVVVIGILSNKREVRNGLILEIEDLTGKMICFADKERNFSVYLTLLKVPLDSVIGLRVRKIRASFFIVEEVFLPEPRKRILREREDLDVFVVLTSDLHVGSKNFFEKGFIRFIKWLNGEYGDENLRKIASKVKYLVIAGDLVDGVGVYPGQERQLIEVRVEKQYKNAAELLQLVPEYVEIIVIPGNHDATLHTLPQPPIWREYAEELYELPNVHLFGNPVNVCLHGVNLYCFHGVSLEDILTYIPGLRKERISEVMKILLLSGHVAPMYGGKARLYPSVTDELVIPLDLEIFHAGHIHIVDQQVFNGVRIINSGTWQLQTDYQRETGLVPTPGKIPVVNLGTNELRILSFI